MGDLTPGYLSIREGDFKWYYSFHIMILQASHMTVTTFEPIAWVIFLFFTALTSGIAGYVGARYKKSGEIDTLTEKLNEVIEQQAKLTKATESVKEDIKHQVWRKQELEQLKREKLDEYAQLLKELSFDFQNLIDVWVNSNGAHISSSVELPKAFNIDAVILQCLYLPELDSVHKQVSEAFRELDDVANTIAYEFRKNEYSDTDSPDEIKRKKRNYIYNYSSEITAAQYKFNGKLATAFSETAAIARQLNS